MHPLRGERFASASMPVADLLVARWPNAGTAPTSRISSASSRDPLSKPQSNTYRASQRIDLNYAEPWIAQEFLMYHSVRGVQLEIRKYRETTRTQFGGWTKYR